MGTDTACDTCILINFALVDRMDLLATLTEFKLCIPEDVWAEIERPDLRQVVEQHLRSGQLQLVRLDAHKEISRLYGRHQGFAEAAEDYAALASSHEKLVEALKGVEGPIENEIARGGGIFSEAQRNNIYAALAEAENLTK